MNNRGMESIAVKKIKVFRSKQEIDPLLREWEKSGQSVKDFCVDMDIAEGTFYHWKEKFVKRSVSQKVRFAPVEIVPTTVNGLFAEVGRVKILPDRLF